LCWPKQFFTLLILDGKLLLQFLLNQCVSANRIRIDRCRNKGKLHSIFLFDPLLVDGGDDGLLELVCGAEGEE
jgi:hypothetical protein